ncbi:MAG TPA: acetamidase/formamidase family protein [Gaiellales bacterium]|jgi:acetamidase/formamidase|nr:acetamidase/formamidase family protein [Gaiellales bacterium]
MADHTLPAETFQVSFDASIPAALEIDPGDTVTFQTSDVAYERLAAGESVDAIGLPNFNRVTGPVSVRGAAPGDALRIEVLDVQVRRAWSVWLPGFGGLGHRSDVQRAMQTPLADGQAQIGSHRVALRPMIGCIGTAPAEGAGSTFEPAYPFGGNMDLREMEPGTTVYLPVNVSGGLLSMGDLHAAMGTAEPTSVSLEAAGQATLRIGLEPAMGLRFPRLRRGGETFFLGIAESFDEAHALALDQAYDHLVGERGIDPFEAYALISARCDMRLGGPASAIVMAVLPDDWGAATLN